MASQAEKHSKTESPSKYKLKKAREKGQVAKSQDLAATIAMGLGMIVFLILCPQISKSFSELLAMFMKDFNLDLVSSFGVNKIMVFSIKAFLVLIIPILASIWVSAFVSTSLQVGFHVSAEPLVPKFDKINPVDGFKRLVSTRGLVSVALSVLKMIVLVAVTSTVLLDQSNTITLLNLQSNFLILNKSSSMLWELIIKAVLTLLTISFIDFAYQKWQFHQDQKMTKQEVKDEYKETEGNPQIKSKIRSIQKDAAQKRGLKEAVQDADVVVTNPFHIAVALRYDRDQSFNAPIVVAKGARLLAQRIKDFAREAEVEIVQNIPLARALYKQCNVDQEITPDLYVAVAEVLAIVFQSKEKKKQRRMGMLN